MQNAHILYYDGQCGLCQGSVKWLLRLERADAHDRQALYLASLDSKWAEDLPPGLPDSIVYREGDRIYTKSKAVFKLCGRLRRPWKWLALGRFIPTFLADALYDLVAKIRKYTRTEAALCDNISPRWKARLLM